MSQQLAGTRAFARIITPRANRLSFVLVVAFAAVLGLAFAIAAGI